MTVPPPAQTNNAEKRVLQIVENLENRAVESWLLRIFQRGVVEYPNIRWTFFCTLPKPGEFDETVRAAGGVIIYSKHPLHDKLAFMTALRKTMRKGRYDVLHCHHDIMSAAYLLASAGLPIRKRIVHLHNTSLSLPTLNRLKTSVMKEPMRQVCLKMADRVVGISREALKSITGTRFLREGRDLVVHYGIDTKSFADSISQSGTLREEFGLPHSAKILLFVGRLVPYKNPTFVIEVLEQLRKIDSDFHLLILGQGPLDSELRELVKSKGLEQQVRLLGFRTDVPRIMNGSDALIWPSLEEPMEGLGLGIVEAQAAGLPIVMSLSVPKEAIVIPELVRAIPLAMGPETWAREITKLITAELPSKKSALHQVESSSFSMSQGVSNIMSLYCDR